MTITLVCPFCRFSREVNKDKIPLGAKSAICPYCKKHFEFSSQIRDQIGADTGVMQRGPMGADGGFGPLSGKKNSPWENRSEIGTWQSLFITIKKSLFSPVQFFKTLALNGGLVEPFTFGLIVGSLGSMFGLFWHYLEVSLGADKVESSFLGQMNIGMFFVTSLIIIPIMVAAGVYVYSGILHSMLLVMKGGKNGFAATFKVIAYSQAAQVWGLVPFIGGFIGGIWQLVILIIGLKEVQETSFFKVITAFIIPFVVILVVVVAAIIPILINFIGL